MTSFYRIMAGLVLGCYLALIGIQTFHTHTTAALNAQDDCQICKIAHQSPSLINPPAVPQSPIHFTRTTAKDRTSPAFHLVDRSYGPAPPTA